jgi:hypothetical protein
MESIGILPADKGNSTVIMKIESYRRGMKKMIEDEKTYKKLSRDPTSTFEAAANTEIKILWQKGIIEEAQMRRMTRLDSFCPRIYGLPKVHKLPSPIPPDPEIKFRPIVACLKSPLYNLSRFLSDIINRAIDQEMFNVKNSHEFREKVCLQQLPPGYELISLDVVSLFTCIPWILVEDAIKKKWADLERESKMSQDRFIRLTKMTIENSYFCFEGDFYKQIDGTAMGLPGSPAIADLVMTILLETVVPRLSEDFIFLGKYVDDLSGAVKIGSTLKVLNEFNSYHPAIQFTIEEEVDGKIPFLDMLLNRHDDGRITTDFYEKKTASGRILNWNSCHPINTKVNTATNFVRRMFDLTSADQKPVNRAREFLLNNGFPHALSSRLINKCLLSNTNTSRPARPNRAAMNVKSMLFVDGITQKISKILKRENELFSLALRSRNKVGAFFTRLKDPLDPKHASSVIYAVACSTCADRNYIGQTRQRLAKRMSGHKSSLKQAEGALTMIPRTDDNIRLVSKGSALVYHSMTTNHSFKLDDPKILHTSRNPRRLNVLEMLHIQDNRTVNKRTDCDFLSRVYKGLLEKIKPR